MRYLLVLMFTLAASSAFAVPCGTSGQFNDNGDGTITDSNTGLTWKKCLEGLSGTACTTGTATSYTWQNALNLTANGWRVPNIKELQSIVDEAKATFVDNDPLKDHNPAIETACFPTPLNAHVYVWSASHYAGNTANSWVIDFYDGRFYNIKPQTDTANVRLVKDPQ